MKRMMIAVALAMLLAGNLGFRPELDPRNPIPATGICFEGVIESMTSNPAAISVSRRVVHVPKEALVEAETGSSTFANLKVGLRVRACGWLQPDKSVLATHIEILADK